MKVKTGTDTGFTMGGGALEFYKFSVVPKYIYTMKQYCYLFYYKCVKLQNTNFYFVRTGF